MSVTRRLREEPGFALSAVLHLLLAAAALWYAAVRPVLPQQPLHTVPVELVMLTALPGPSAGALPAPVRGAPRPREDAAPTPQGTRPDATQQPQDELSAKLRALAQLRQPDTALAFGGGNGDGGAAGNGSYALRDFVRAQILRRWLPDLTETGSRETVAIRIVMTATGVILTAEIVDQARYAADIAFRDTAISARNAALLASPIGLPPGRYPTRTVLTIDLDPRAALR